MSEIDKTNIDAMYWTKEYLKRDPSADGELLMGYFANYRFAISDPLDARIEALEQQLSALQEENEVHKNEIDFLRPELERVKKELRLRAIIPEGKDDE